MKTDDLRRVVLTTLGTHQDLAKYGITLQEGMSLDVYSDDADDKGQPDNLVASGAVRYDQARSRWTLEIDDKGVRHESDIAPSGRHEGE